MLCAVYELFEFMACIVWWHLWMRYNCEVVPRFLEWVFASTTSQRSSTQVGIQDSVFATTDVSCQAVPRWLFTCRMLSKQIVIKVSIQQHQSSMIHIEPRSCLSHSRQHERVIVVTDVTCWSLHHVTESQTCTVIWYILWAKWRCTHPVIHAAALCAPNVEAILKPELPIGK